MLAALPRESKNCTSVVWMTPSKSFAGRLAPMPMLLVAVAVPPTRLRFTVVKKSVETMFWLAMVVVAVLVGITLPPASTGHACRKKPAVLRRNPSLSWKKEPARVYRNSLVMVGVFASLTIKNPCPEMDRSVDEVDDCNRPWTPVSVRGLDCTPPGEKSVEDVCLVTRVWKSTRVFL